MSAAVTVGTVIGDFRVTALVAHGGMASVYAAVDTRTGEEVALKVLDPELSASDQFRRRFVREAGYASHIAHPNVVRVRDVGDAEGHQFLAMELVRGTDLRDVLAREAPLSAARTVELLQQVADALDAIHSAGLLHRDVKPANVLIASGEGGQPAGRCYLTDFGLAKNPTADSRALTASGDFVGSFYYVAPEQVLGTEPRRESDVYSLGCVLYECLTGAPPFPGTQMDELLRAHIEDPPPRVTDRRADLPVAIDEVIRRALAKNPDERYLTCTSLLAAAADALLPSGPRTITLLVTAGAAQGQRIEIYSELELGRAAAGAGALAGDAELSRRHARIHADGGGHLIEDLGSSNGTAVNGVRIDRPTPLAQGDSVELGGTVLLVQEIGPPPLRITIEVDFDARKLRIDPPGLYWKDGRWQARGRRG